MRNVSTKTTKNSLCGRGGYFSENQKIKAPPLPTKLGQVQVGMDVTKIVSLPAAFVRQLARFEHVSPFTSFMVAAAALGIALAIPRQYLQRPQISNSKAGHEAILNGGLA
jgi:hypothetical protein